MTCVVGYVDHLGIMHMAADSFAADSNYSVTKISTKKIFKKNNMLIGFCGSFRAPQIIEYSSSFPKQKPNQSDMEYLVNHVVTSIKEEFKSKSYAVAADEDFGLLVALNGNLYEIESNMQVIAHEKHYASIGSGFEYATGYLYALENKRRGRKPTNIKDILVNSIKCAEEFVSNVGGRIDYLFVE